MSDVVEHGAVGPAAPLLAPHYNDVQDVKNEVFNAAREGRQPNFEGFSDIAIGAAGFTRNANIMNPAPYIDPGQVNEVADAAFAPVVVAEANTPPAEKKAAPKTKPAKKAAAKKTAATAK